MFVVFERRTKLRQPQLSYSVRTAPHFRVGGACELEEQFQKGPRAISPTMSPTMSSTIALTSVCSLGVKPQNTTCSSP
eukprot:7386300-Prymnesium_polylepis.1